MFECAYYFGPVGINELVGSQPYTSQEQLAPHPYVTKNTVLT